MSIPTLSREDSHMRRVDMKGARETLKTFGIGAKLYLHCESNATSRLAPTPSACYKEALVPTAAISNDAVQRDKSATRMEWELHDKTREDNRVDRSTSRKVWPEIGKAKSNEQNPPLLSHRDLCSGFETGKNSVVASLCGQPTPCRRELTQPPLVLHLHRHHAAWTTKNTKPVSHVRPCVAIATDGTLTILGRSFVIGWNYSDEKQQTADHGCLALRPKYLYWRIFKPISL